MSGLLELIREHREEIVAQAVRKLRLAHPGHDDAELFDEMHAAFDNIEHTLERDRGSVEPAAPGLLVDAMDHGKQRHRLAFDPASVVHDYGVICDAVFTVADANGMSPTARETQVFSRVIDEAAANAITAYWQEEHTEKRRETGRQLGTLAHELRNALASARMAFQLIREGRAPANGRSAELIVAAFDRMQRLIADALDQARVRGTAPPVRQERVELGALLRDVVDATVRYNDVAIDVSADESLAVEADARLLTSALSNLLGNAVKFTRPRGRVEVRSFALGAHVIVEVEDECGGLPEGATDELFQPFVQKGSERSGVGLGLAITREAVEAHGGVISVRNLPGKGCVFRIELRSLSVRPYPATLNAT
jgi:signal transduction histidine kinase